MADSLSSKPENVQITQSKLEAPGFGFDRWWLLVIIDVILIIVLAVFIPDPFGRIVAYVSDGIGITVEVTVISFLLITVIGLLGGLGRLAKNPIINGISTLYVEIIRGIPLLVQLIFWYFAFTALVKNFGSSVNIAALANFNPDPIVMAIFGLSFCYGAYMSEVYRAGIQSIGKGQMEAARSLGMSQTQAMRYVILPQAVRVILPPMGNEFISLLKDSSLVSVVAVADLTRRGREFMSATAYSFETWAIVAMIYLVMTILSARVVNWIERKTKTA